MLTLLPLNDAMFTEAKLIYDIAKDFFSHRDTMRKAQADARQRAADYFTGAH